MTRDPARTRSAGVPAPPPPAREPSAAIRSERTEGFSPVDIEYAARKASRTALESAVCSGADDSGPSTDDCAAAIASTRATVSPQVAAEFLEDIVTFRRV